jgi:hypothetical protein
LYSENEWICKPDFNLCKILNKLLPAIVEKKSYKLYNKK